MSHGSKSAPSYRLKKPTTLAVVTLTASGGRRKDVLLGTYGSAESHAKYERVIAEWEAAGRTLPEDDADGAVKGVPKYARHRSSGQARVTLTSPGGVRRDVLLGRFGSAESRREYARVIAEWEAAGRSLPKNGTGPTPDITVAEMLVRYWTFAEGYYPPAGTIDDLKFALRPLRELYGHTFAKDFGPLALEAIRNRMVAAGLCRKVVNRRVGQIKRAFKWAVAKEIVPPSVFHGLQAVEGLKKGRCAAPDHAKVKPVDDAHVDAVLPFLPKPVRAMIQLQRVTGMRPAEVCLMRAADIDATGPVWTYRPAHHKTLHHGKVRTVTIGPRGQDILKPWIAAAPTADDYLFSPRRAVEARAAERRLARVVPIRPKQEARRAKLRAKVRKRPPGERYDAHGYNRAIARACRRAGVPTWGPNRLRHNYATDIRRRFGLEAAQVLLGHSKADVTQVYAERDLGLAEKIAAEVG